MRSRPKCFGYIDDTILVADTHEEALQSCSQLASTLDNLGFVIHEQRLVLQPKQSIVFLGFELNSNTMTVTLIEAKVNKFMCAVHDLSSCKKPTIRVVAGLIGLMVAYLPAIPYGSAYVKMLEINKNKALKEYRGNFDVKMIISQESWQDMDRWVINLPESAVEIYALWLVRMECQDLGSASLILFCNRKLLWLVLKKKRHKETIVNLIIWHIFWRSMNKNMKQGLLHKTLIRVSKTFLC